MNPLRVLVADDHEVVRRGLRALLETQRGWEVCGEATNGREAVEKANECRPDVVLLDLCMPELGGLETTRQILKTVPGTEILVLTMHESEQALQDVLEAGARACLMKSDAGRDLLAAVQALSHHQPFFSSRVGRMISEDFKSGGEPKAVMSPGILTPREREIIRMLAEGKTAKDVASALNITLKTTETHRTNIMRKLDLHSATDLVRYAIRNGIVAP
jgi:DNA-binding NarL/FixJ family response regulator